MFAIGYSNRKYFEKRKFVLSVDSTAIKAGIYQTCYVLQDCFIKYKINGEKLFCSGIFDAMKFCGLFSITVIFHCPFSSLQKNDPLSYTYLARLRKNTGVNFGPRSFKLHALHADHEIFPSIGRGRSRVWNSHCWELIF